jgi:hypothetical protein
MTFPRHSASYLGKAAQRKAQWTELLLLVLPDLHFKPPFGSNPVFLPCPESSKGASN